MTKLEEKLEKYKIKNLEDKSQLIELREKDKFDLVLLDNNYMKFCKENWGKSWL